jgi:MFS family permease
VKINEIVPRGLPRGVWVVTVTTAVLMSGFGMIIPFMPVYAKSLGATATQLSWVMGGFFIGRMVGQVPAGVITDRVGRRVVILVALVGYTLSGLGYANAHDPLFLVPFRVIQGISAGFFSVASRSLVNDLAGPEKRGAAMGMYNAAISLGFTIGPFLGSRIGHRFGMNVQFWTCAFLSLMSLFVLTFVSFIGRKPAKPTRTFQERFTALLMDRRIRLVALTNVCFMAGMSSVNALFSVAAKAEIEGGYLFVGTAITIAGASGMIIGPVSGRLSDLFGRKPVMLLGVLLTAAQGTVLMLTRTPLYIGIGFFFGGIGGAAFGNSMYAQLGDLTTTKNRGTATGLVGFAGYSGGFAGSLLAPLIWEYTNLRLPFGLQLVFTLFAVGSILWLWRLKK